MKICRSILVIMRNFTDKIVEKEHTSYVQKHFSPESRAICEIMWKNVVEPDRPQMTM
jgi:hypothetical protein